MEIIMENCSLSIPQKKKLKHRFRQLWYANPLLPSSSEEDMDIQCATWGNELSTEQYRLIVRCRPPSSASASWKIFMEAFPSSSSLKEEDKEQKQHLRQKISQKLYHMRQARNTHSSHPEQSSAAWTMYHKMIAHSPSFSSILPNPTTILEQREQYETLLRQPSLLSQNPGFQQYLRACLS